MSHTYQVNTHIVTPNFIANNFQIINGFKLASASDLLQTNEPINLVSTYVPSQHMILINDKSINLYLSFAMLMQYNQVAISTHQLNLNDKLALVYGLIQSHDRDYLICNMTNADPNIMNVNLMTHRNIIQQQLNECGNYTTINFSNANPFRVLQIGDDAKANCKIELSPTPTLQSSTSTSLQADSSKQQLQDEINSSKALVISLMDLIVSKEPVPNANRIKSMIELMLPKIKANRLKATGSDPIESLEKQLGDLIDVNY
ncbi:Hypothetical protein MVR_LOCUS65 [uncultured virus]|nr:Hypothetical protein MVR_LOCUS65 [uncultured virus]